MKLFIKLVLLLGVFYSSLFSSIDEYKSDLYYANGIMINDSEKMQQLHGMMKLKNCLLVIKKV